MFTAAHYLVKPNLLDNTKKIRRKLDKFKQNYDWTHQLVDPNIKEATQLWDNVQQTHQCCSLYKIGDWSLKRPNNIESNIYPTSCCPNIANSTGACDSGRIYKKSCMSDIHLVRKNFSKLFIGLIWPSIILTYLGSIVLYSKRKRESLEKTIVCR